MGLMSQLATIFGVAIVSFIGNKILVSVGQTELAKALDVLVTVGVAVYVVKKVYDGFQIVIHTFGGYLL